MTTRSRRDFLRASAIGGGAATLSAAAFLSPGEAAAQAVGVKARDLPDLTVREVKVYITDLGDYRSLNQERGELVSVVTASGLEGVYTLGNRNATPNWLEWAKATLVGKSVLELLPTLTSTSGTKGPYGFDGDFSGARGGLPRYNGGSSFHPTPKFGTASAFDTAGLTGSGLVSRGGGNWPNWYTSSADVCLWDILGQAVGLPIYRILPGGIGGTKDRLVCYASSTHHPSLEEYGPEALKAKQQNFKAYKIHPGVGAHRTGPAIPAYIGHMEEIRQVRAAVGDEFVLAHDPVQMYNRYEAMAVGRLLDELNYAWFEDPIRTGDMDGLIELRKALVATDPRRRVPLFDRGLCRIYRQGRPRRGAADLGQCRRDQRIDAGRPARRRLRAGMHAAQLGQSDRPHDALPSRTGAAQRRLVRSALPARSGRPSLHGHQVPPRQKRLHLRAEAAGHGGAHQPRGTRSPHEAHRSLSRGRRAGQKPMRARRASSAAGGTPATFARSAIVAKRALVRRVTIAAAPASEMPRIAARSSAAASFTSIAVSVRYR